jgi:hypothetical protein
MTSKVDIPLSKISSGSLPGTSHESLGAASSGSVEGEIQENLAAYQLEQTKCQTAYSRLMQQPSIPCVIPGKTILLTPRELEYATHTYCITPNGSGMVLVSTQLFHHWLKPLIIESQQIPYSLAGKSFPPTWITVIDPTNGAPYQAVNAIDYLALGFIFDKATQTYLAPHDLSYQSSLIKAQQLSLKDSHHPRHSNPSNSFDTLRLP